MSSGLLDIAISGWLVDKGEQSSVIVNIYSQSKGYYLGSYSTSVRKFLHVNKQE